MNMMELKGGCIDVTLINERGQVIHQFWVPLQHGNKGEGEMLAEARLRVIAWCEATGARFPRRVLFDFC